MQGGERTEDATGTPRGIVIFFRALALLAVLFGALIFVTPLGYYQLIGNCFEAFVAAACLAASLYAYLNWSRRESLLLAAFAFGGYALSTGFWYLFTVPPELGRGLVFVSVAELGILGFFLLFIAIITIEFPGDKIPVSRSLLLVAVFLAVPLLVIWGAGYRDLLRLVVLAVQFLVAEQLFEVSVRHRVYRYKLLWAGICLWCLTGGMLYGIRETYFSAYDAPLFDKTVFTQSLTVNQFLSIIGPMAIISFTLIQLGLFRYILERRESGSGMRRKTA